MATIHVVIQFTKRYIDEDMYYFEEFLGAFSTRAKASEYIQTLVQKDTLNHHCNRNYGIYPVKVDDISS